MFIGIRMKGNVTWIQVYSEVPVYIRASVHLFKLVRFVYYGNLFDDITLHKTFVLFESAYYLRFWICKLSVFCLFSTQFNVTERCANICSPQPFGRQVTCLGLRLGSGRQDCVRVWVQVRSLPVHCWLLTSRLSSVVWNILISAIGSKVREGNKMQKCGHR